MQFYQRKATAGQSIAVTMARRDEPAYGNPLKGDVRPPNEKFGMKGHMPRDPKQAPGGMGASVRSPNEKFGMKGPMNRSPK